MPRPRDAASGVVRIRRFEGALWTEVRTGPRLTDWEPVSLEGPYTVSRIVRSAIRYAVNRALTREKRGAR